MVQYNISVSILTLSLVFISSHCLVIPSNYGNYKLSSDNLLDSVLAEEEKSLYQSVLNKLLDAAYTHRDAIVEQETEGDLYPDLTETDSFKQMPQTVSKRKVFWQPLGMQSPTSRGAQMKHPSGGYGHTHSFRYGR